MSIDNDLRRTADATVGETPDGSSASSLSAGEVKPRRWLPIVVFLVIVALVAVFIVKSKLDTRVQERPVAAGQAEPAGRVRVPEGPGPVAGVPATAPQQAQPKAEDPEKLRREREAAARAEAERRMHEQRLKSAIVAMESGNPSESPRDADSRASQQSGASDPNSRFLSAEGNTPVAVAHAWMIEGLDQKILQGRIIEAILEPRAISDLPGLICATVQENVYSEQAHNLLIPWGSRTCGKYNAQVRKGQDRLFVIWQRLVRPDGGAVSLASAGADQLGSIGMAGDVDNHFGEIFGVSAALSIVGAGVSNTGGLAVTNGYSSEAQYRNEMQQSFAQTSNQVLAPYAAIPPSITVYPATRVRIYLHQDLDFSSVSEKNNFAGPLEIE